MASKDPHRTLVRYHGHEIKDLTSLSNAFSKSRPIQILVVIVSVLLAPARLSAQEPASPAEAHHHADAAPADRWSWSTDGNAFFGYNRQQRKYADFSAWESQNWGMLAGSRTVGRGKLTVEGMVSLEPFTIKALGSPQLFQTGESYQQVPLVNYQHPHDLLMALGATYRLERPRVTYLIAAALVGSPALGPTAFMHRESARDNPQAPLSHHSLDSTHITPGVLTAGVGTGPLMFEASLFRGEEPDENRTNIERPRFNSWSTRVSWRRGSWNAQISGGRLHDPEWFEPYMVTRLTASIGFNGSVTSRPMAATIAWGENREDNGFANVDDSYLAEWDLRATAMTTVYGRAERATKQVLGLGFHPRGFTHPHFYSHIDAVTLGLVRDLPVAGSSRVGLGADITVYPRTSLEMTELYEGSHSYHVFVRWRPRGTPPGHVH